MLTPVCRLLRPTLHAIAMQTQPSWGLSVLIEALLPFVSSKFRSKLYFVAGVEVMTRRLGGCLESRCFVRLLTLCAPCVVASIWQNLHLFLPMDRIDLRTTARLDHFQPLRGALADWAAIDGGTSGGFFLLVVGSACLPPSFAALLAHNFRDSRLTPSAFPFCSQSLSIR